MQSCFTFCACLPRKIMLKLYITLLPTKLAVSPLKPPTKIENKNNSRFPTVCKANAKLK